MLSKKIGSASFSRDTYINHHHVRVHVHSMTSTVSRSTPSLAVPSTQNTAPVLDFRCLYTHDLRRKAKRWQDGIARFHTFNKRVMVYDEPRNFIGDTHWREPQPIQDGDELQLDKGILIQIGEATGKTDQDISGLFERKKAASLDADLSPARSGPTPAPATSTVRIVETAPSQLRPRTLNSLLGTPKGHLGRAALPVKSPFELRQISGAENALEGRAAKRQRLSYPETRVVLSSPPSRPEASSSKAGHKLGLGARNDDHTPTEPSEVVTRPSKWPKKAKDSTLRPQPLHVSERKSAKPRAKQAPKERDLGPAMKRAPRNSAKLRGQHIDPSEVINIDLDGPSQDGNSQGTRLRIVSSKPRKKLLYRDLLPQARRTGEMPSNNPTPVNHKEKRKEKITTDLDPLSQFHHEEQDRLNARLKKHDGRRDPTVQAGDDLQLFNTEAIFVSQDDHTHVAVDLRHERETAVSPVRRIYHPELYQQEDAHETPNITKIPPPKEPTPPDDPNAELARMDAFIIQHRLPAPPTKLALPHKKLPTSKPYLTSEPVIAPQRLNPAPPSPPKQLRPNVPSPLRQPRTAKEPLQRSLSAVITTAATIQQPKHSLRKTVSDTAALGSGSRTRKDLVPPVSVEAAPDPWSSEAWELFGWKRGDFADGGKDGG